MAFQEDAFQADSFQFASLISPFSSLLGKYRVHNLFDDEWNIGIAGGTGGLTAVGISNTLLWNVLANVNASRTFLWNTRATVNNSKIVLWNDRSTVNKSDTLVWNIKAVIGKQEQLVWNVRNRTLECIRYNTQEYDIPMEHSKQGGHK
jgi:hypothetical protein